MSKPAFDKENFKSCDPELGESTVPDLVDDLLARGLNVNKAKDGIMHTEVPQPFVSFDAAQNEKVIANGNAFIVFGSDRPGTQASGMGGPGIASDTIDLVVGRMATAYGGKGACDGMIVGNSFAADAARIYISRLTKVDLNFGIQRTQNEQIFDEPEEPRSAIAMKADKVRIVGREGVKIITGRAQNVKGYGTRGETNSLGGKLEFAPRIDLIAGNYLRHAEEGLLASTVRSVFDVGDERIDYLQPIALGYHTRDALKELSEILDTLIGYVVQGNTFTTTTISGMGSALFPLAGLAGGLAASQNLFSIAPSMYLRFRKVGWDFRYLNDGAPKAVWSRNVNST